MNYLVWRQHRQQLIVAAGALFVFAVIAAITGIKMNNDYHSALLHCGATDSCDQLPDLLFRGDGAIIDLIALTTIVPGLMGLFWGAPLIAREIEDRTSNLMWTQSVTRRRWFTVKVAWLLAAAAVWGAVISGLVMWWSRPENSLHQYRFDPAHFDTQGLMPIGYALFAVALGLVVGVIWRRTLPALATTLGVFVGVRLLIDLYVRPHYQAAVKQVLPLVGATSGNPGSSWALSDKIVTPTGQTLDFFSRDSAPVQCQQVRFQGRQAFTNCLNQAGYRRVTTYQPANRYWTFQGIEFALFAVLAAVMVGVAYYVVVRSDA